MRISARGFTLLELMVVLAILAALSVVVLPAITGGSGVELRAATRDLAAALRHARSEAMMRNAPATLILDVEARRFRISTDQRVRALPHRLRYALYTARSELLGTHTGAIRFFADGSSTGGRITVSVPRGPRAVIDVDWLTGRVHISKDNDLTLARSGGT